MNSSVLKTRGSEICSFTHFVLCSPPFSVVDHYYLFSYTIIFGVFAFFVALLCSRVCVIKHSISLNFSVFHRSEIALQIFLRVVSGTIVTLIPLSFFLWVPRLVDAVDEGFACVRCFCSSFSQIPPWFRLSMLSLKNEIINHFRVPKTLTFKTGLSAKPFSCKLVLYACQKIIEFVTCWLR